MPYHPHSQGACERIHKTIRSALVNVYLENINNFNLVEALNKVVKNYNRKIHTVTKFSPIEIFYSNNKNLFDDVYKNTINYYANNKISNINYKIGEKCLISNNILLSKKKFQKKYIIIEKNKIKNNKSFIKIIGEIKEVLGAGYYLVKILQHNNSYNLKKDDSYVIPFNLLHKASEDIIKKLMEFNDNNKNIELTEENSEEKISTSSENYSLSESDNNDLEMNEFEKNKIEFKRSNSY